MFCSKCGKAISNQAKFCNYCGNPVNAAQPQTQSAPQSAPQAAPAPKKKGNAGKLILRVLVILVVYFSVRFIAENVAAGKQKADSPNNGQIVISGQDSNFEQGFKEAQAADPDVTDAVNSCVYGAIYQNGYLRYGLMKLNVPGYSVVADEAGERDFLMSPDGTCVLTVYRQLEVLDVSFDASTEEEMLDSIRQDYSDASMIAFEKLNVDGFPVIRYIIACTVDGSYQYQGELIVFPSETTNKTIRLAAFVDGESGYGADVIDQVFDTLEVSPDFRVQVDEAGVMGLNHITAK